CESSIPRAAGPVGSDTRYCDLFATDVFATRRELVSTHNLAGNWIQHLLWIRPLSKRNGHSRDRFTGTFGRSAGSPGWIGCRRGDVHVPCHLAKLRTHDLHGRDRRYWNYYWSGYFFLRPFESG